METPFTAPWLARIVPKASGIIAERGSAAGHLATISREFRVPALVGVAGAMKMFDAGEEITLDTYNRCVYRGRVRALLNYELMHSLVFEDAAEFRLLRRLLKRIAPLGRPIPRRATLARTAAPRFMMWCAISMKKPSRNLWTFPNHCPGRRESRYGPWPRPCRWT